MTYPTAGKRTLCIVLALLLTAATAMAQGRVAITPVTVVDVTGGSLQPEKTVVVEGDRIVAVGPVDDVTVPEDAEVVDGRGGYLIPGLWDMHVHAARAGRAPRFWPLFLAHGVTGIREMGSFTDSLLYWRSESSRPNAVAPRIYWSPTLDGEPPVHSYAIVVADAAAAAAVVDSLDRLGFDFLKVYDRLSREAYFAILDRARQHGIPVVGHVPHSVSAIEASDAGQKSFEHETPLLMPCVPGAEPLAIAYGRAVARHGAASDSARAAVERLIGVLAFAAPDAAECRDLLERMIANRTWLTPTLAAHKGQSQPSSFEGDPRMRWVPAATDEYWRENRRLTPEQEAQVGSKIMDNAVRTVGLAHRAGVGILAGTDASGMPYIFAGSSLHDELLMCVEAGLSPLEALRTATINPARFLGREGDLGSVEEGKLADLVLLDANPLEDISNTQRIRAVVADGRLYRRAELDRLLAEVEAAVQDADDQE